jgi:hypothetical protein
MMDPHLILVALIGGHFIADYPLQGDFLARAKNQTAPVPGFPWWQALGAHAAIHGTFVALITGVWWLWTAETLVHFITDDLKCRGKIGINTDQAIHLLCKVVWFFIPGGWA